MVSVFAAALLTAAVPCVALVISEARFAATSFTPSRADTVRLEYRLSAPGNVSIYVVDPDGGLVRELVANQARDAGVHVETWDGRDVDGKVVPDEAYTAVFTSAGDQYDPSQVSGGQVGDITTTRFDAEAGVLVYQLPAPARVLIRCGLHNGPMLKTLVDWRPRVSGAITETWDGYDEDRLIFARGHKDFTALITYMTLPEATVITFGNDAETYRDYKLGRARERMTPVPRTPRRGNLVPPAWSRAPRVTMTFPATSAQVPTVSGSVEVRVDVEESDRHQLLSDQFEVIFFVDNVFYAEAERGHLPYNWKWEVPQLAPGEHTLTVNISSFRGQVGVASRKVRVIEGSP